MACVVVEFQWNWCGGRVCSLSQYSTSGLHNRRPAGPPKPFIAVLEIVTKLFIATLKMEKAISRTFTSACTKKPSKIYLLCTLFAKQCCTYICKHLYAVCEQTFSLMNFNENKNNVLL